MLTTYLRDGPDIRYRAIDELQTGTVVVVLDCADAWCHVFDGSIGGYVRARALAIHGDVPAGSGKPSCFIDAQASYHGSRDVQFCSPRAAPAGPPAHP